MNQIKFSHNWNNKLNNKIFTTIRRHNPEKLKHYDSSIGDVFTVYLNNEIHCHAELIDVDAGSLRSFGRTVLRLDTGQITRADILEVFKRFGIGEDDAVIVLTFVKPE